MTDDPRDEEKRRLDRELDRELEATFPASDALKVIRPRRGKKSSPTEQTAKAARRESRRSDA
jgi:hypothetical protein